MSRTIHPLAVVEDGVEVGDDVTIEPHAVVKRGVILKNRVYVSSHSYLEGNTTVGEGTKIYPGACIGGKPQALRFRGEKTYVIIGKNCEIREYVTINSSLGDGSSVVIGDECLIMAYSHIAHNCIVGNRVIISNNGTLAGHVEVEDYAILGGMTPVHQNVRIGRFAMVGGLSRVTHDVPPYTIGAGGPYKLGGLNLVGLKRHGFSLAVRSELARAFYLFYRRGFHFQEAMMRAKEELADIPEVRHWLEFCAKTKRGLIGLQGVKRKIYTSAEEGKMAVAPSMEELEHSL